VGIGEVRPHFLETPKAPIPQPVPEAEWQVTAQLVDGDLEDELRRGGSGRRGARESHKQPKAGQEQQS
jgi:hypothetical protein